MPYQVRGNVLRSMREDLRVQRLKGAPWTQQYVADQAGVNLSTYGDMERKPEQRFDIVAIECVCTVLRLNLAAVVIAPNAGDVVVTAPRLVDFRPANAWDSPEWEHSRLIVGVDKMSFHLGAAVDQAYTLTGMQLTMPALTGREVFHCRFLSRIAPGQTNHLGIFAEFTAMAVPPMVSNDRHGWTFKSNGDLGVTFKQFHDMVETLPSNSLLAVEVLLDFNTVIVKKAYHLATSQIHSYMMNVRKLGQPYLKFMQPEVLEL